MDRTTLLDRRRVLGIAALTTIPSTILAAAGPREATTTPTLPTAHAHNDYQQPRPLTGALELGFTSIEVDVFARNDRLLVGHVPSELRADRDLGSMYLDPILARCRAAGKSDSGPLLDGHRLTLLIDLKTGGTKTLELLLPLLEPLQPWLRRVENGHLVDGPVEVILSGSRPIAAVRSLENRPVFIDGRISDLGKGIPTDLMPLVSTAMRPSLGTLGLMGLDDPARQRLANLVERTHGEGRRLRFWGHAESRAIWKALVEARVDHIGTDLPRSLAKWLARNDPRCRP